MCTLTRRELKKRRGYSEVLYLLRAHNVQRDTIGHEFLEIAIMNYLHDANLEIEDLLKIVHENSSMKISQKEECLKKMKSALQNINAPIDLLEKDSIVIKFIKKVSTEVRMRALLELRIVSEELNEVTEYVKGAFCNIAMRKMEKPEECFVCLINYVSGCYGYDDTGDLVKDLYKIVSNTEMIEMENAKKEIEDLVEVFIQEYINVIF